MASEIKSLVEIVKIKGGKRLPKGESLQTDENKHPYIRVRDMGGRYIPKNGLEYVPENIFPKISRYIVEENDVIISIVGTVGLVSIIDKYFHKASQTENCAKLSGLSEVDAKYLYYYLISPCGQQEISTYTVGAVQPKLPLYGIESISVPWFKESKRAEIAHILGSLDDKIELNRQMNETLEAMAQALFKSWFVDFDPVIDNALAVGNAIPDEFIERAEQRKGIEKKDNSDIQGLFPDEFEFTEEMGWIPKGWAVGSLDNMFELQRGFDLPKTKRTDGIYPLMAASGQDGTHDEYKVKGPGVITGRSGKLGIVSFTNANYWPLNTTLWVKNYKQSNPYHAYFFLQTLDLEKYNSGSAVPSLNRNNVHNLIQILPSNIVLDKFQEVIESSFAKIAENNTGIETLAKLRDTLLPKLMSGELRIPDDIF